MSASKVVLPSIRAMKIQRARNQFYEYLRLKDPGFYTLNKPHLKELADMLQKFADGELIAPSGKPAKVFIMNLPPRTGKSYTLTNFCSWLIGRSKFRKTEALKLPEGAPNRFLQCEKIITISYNDNIATDFSRFCRDNFTTEIMAPGDIPFAEIFPGSILKKGDSGAKKWAMEGEFFSYMGGGLKGELIGKGCTLGIIDDPIKSSMDAYNENVLNEWWDFYKNTYTSRIEDGGRQIINHTRWREEDLAGRASLLYGDDCYIYKRCIVENEITERIEVKDEHGNVTGHETVITGGDLLCEEICSWETFYNLQKTIDPSTFRANYFQEPLDSVGKMYPAFKTYKLLPTMIAPIHSYTDTADKGTDSLCSIAYEIHGNYFYVIDVIHTTDPMTMTEPEMADFLHFNQVNYSLMESNNGGSNFNRAVKKILNEEYNSTFTVMSDFTQTKNKETRILVGSHWVAEHIIFPEGWESRWPTFSRELLRHIRMGKNEHDDAADTLTGIYDQHAHANSTSLLPGNF